MQTCNHCKEEIKAGAKVCPHCQKRQGTSQFTGCLAVIILLGLVFLVAALFFP